MGLKYISGNLSQNIFDILTKLCIERPSIAHCYIELFDTSYNFNKLWLLFLLSFDRGNYSPLIN